MTNKLHALSSVFLGVLLVSCGSQPAVNPVGEWSGTGESASGSGPVTLVVTEPTGGNHRGAFTDVLSGTTFFGLDCNVTETSMRCAADYGQTTPGANFTMEGPISDTSYTGDFSTSFGGSSLTGTFDLGRSAQP